jgi:hypothetical protein
MMRLALAFCLLWLTGCAGESPLEPTPIGAAFTLGPGESATAVPSLRIRFVGVTSDSRCPADAICITAGDAVVQIDIVSSRAGSRRYELHTADARPVIHGDVSIHLVQLAPYPFSAMPIDPSEYRATLRVAR